MNHKDHFIMTSDDYHDFDFAKQVLLNAGLEYNYMELDNHENYISYRAVFFVKYTDEVAKIVDENSSCDFNLDEDEGDE